MEAYEEAVRGTASPHAPWYVVPADNKWFTHLVVAAATVDAVERMDLAYPKVGPEKLKELEAARRSLGAGRRPRRGSRRRPRRAPLVR